MKRRREVYDGQGGCSVEWEDVPDDLAKRIINEERDRRAHRLTFAGIQWETDEASRAAMARKAPTVAGSPGELVRWIDAANITREMSGEAFLELCDTAEAWASDHVLAARAAKDRPPEHFDPQALFPAEPRRAPRRRQHATASAPPAPPVDLDPVHRRLADLRANVGELQNRISDLETRAAAPIDPDDDLPSFLRAKGEDDPERPIPRPAQQIAMAQMLERLDAIERDRMRPMEPAPAPPPLAPMLRIAEAGRRQVERTSGPPHRVVEAAHLARAGQDVPLALMQVIGEAMGCGWEDAATTIIRVSDKATETAAQVYAIECAARRRIQAGESPERVAEDSIKAIEGIGG